jgi:hypothetical protein
MVWGGGEWQVAQIMYTHVSKCIKYKIKGKKALIRNEKNTLLFYKLRDLL